MKRWNYLAFVIPCLFLCSGCAKKTVPPARNSAFNAYLSSGTPQSSVVAGLGAGAGIQQPVAPPERFIAVTHQFTVETPEANLAKAWEAVLKLCESMRCEVLASSINSQTPTSPPSGQLSLRIDPGDFNKLLDFLNKSVTVIEHTTQSADRTAEVIDTEAKLKNLTEFRDRLRAMMAKAPANVKDLMEIERELADVQAEIDSFSMTRKALANQTEKIAVQINFRSKPSVTRTGVFAPISAAWDEAGSTFSESLGSLIIFVISVIPWLVLIIPAIWIVVRLLRKRSRRRAGFSADTKES